MNQIQDTMNYRYLNKYLNKLHVPLLPFKTKCCGLLKELSHGYFKIQSDKKVLTTYLLTGNFKCTVKPS